jgi:hypothetical protein
VLPGAIDSGIGNAIASGHNDMWDSEAYKQVEYVSLFLLSLCL